MAKNVPHRQNTESRQKLLNTARELFYEQGYTETTFAQISKVSGINNGLITYYFGNKANLASEIYTSFLLDLRNEIARQLYEIKGNYSLELGISMENRVIMHVKFENENLMRFYVEYSHEREDYAMSNQKRSHYYQLQKRLINPNITDEDLDLYEVCGYAVVTALTEAYSTGRITSNMEHVEDYALRLIFNMLELPPLQIESLIEESKFLQDKLNIRVGKNFKLITN